MTKSADIVAGFLLNADFLKFNEYYLKLFRLYDHKVA